ncbi:MAG: hypothetical protein MN733_40695, partial [Nitrososphaera sp.]|nr:hypothetical protein [Nitrososphaera sp.]
MKSQSPRDEYLATKSEIQRWYKAFPKAEVILGNHDLRALKRAAEANVAHLLRSWSELWNTPNWTWVESLTEDGVKYVHGDGVSGPTAAIRRAMASRQSLVMGHTHSSGGILYHASRNDLIFGLNVGCGVDPTAFAFEYSKDAVNRETLGCGVVVSSSEAYFIPMDLGNKYHRR